MAVDSCGSFAMRFSAEPFGADEPCCGVSETELGSSTIDGESIANGSSSLSGTHADKDILNNMQKNRINNFFIVVNPFKLISFYGTNMAIISFLIALYQTTIQASFLAYISAYTATPQNCLHNDGCYIRLQSR